MLDTESIQAPKFEERLSMFTILAPSFSVINQENFLNFGEITSACQEETRALILLLIKLI